MEKQQQYQQASKQQEQSSFEQRDLLSTFGLYFRLVAASAVVGFLLAVLVAGVSLRYCILPLPPAANFILLICAIVFLACVEAMNYGANCVSKWDMTPYQAKYPNACELQSYINTPVKLKKFIVGRQFTVILIIFLIAQITSFPSMPSNFWGMPSGLVFIIAQVGLPGIALTLTFGQLTCLLFIEEYTLPFLNLFPIKYVVRLCLFIENVGTCHFSWFMYFASSFFCCHSIVKIQKTMTDMEKGEVVHTEPETPMSPTSLNRGPDFDLGIEQNKEFTIFDVIRYIWSIGVTCGSAIIVLWGVGKGECAMKVNIGAAYIILFCALTALAHLEGSMVAIAGTQFWDRETFVTAYPNAYKVHELVNKLTSIKRFIVGRQFCTVLVSFLMAEITTFPHWQSDGFNPALFYIAIKSGLAGVFITLSFGQLLPELLAAEFPLRFINMPQLYPLVCISLFFEWIGTGHAAWAVFYTLKLVLCGGKSGKDVDVNDSVHTKPTVVRIRSAELMHATGSPYGHDSATNSANNSTKGSNGADAGGVSNNSSRGGAVQYQRVL